MEALLWVLVFIGAANTLSVFYFAYKGEFPPITMGARAIDWFISAGLGVWAL